MSIQGTCRLLRLTWDEAGGIIARAVDRGLERRDLSGLRRIGIDEKSVLKGHRYITVVYDLDTSKVVWMGAERTEATLDRFFESLPVEMLRQYDLKTMRAHGIRRAFRHFWNYVYPANARKFFESRYFWATHSRLAPIVAAAKRFNRHLERILSFFRLGATNSTAEGINNKIQTIKKKAYGFRNIGRFINAITTVRL